MCKLYIATGPLTCKQVSLALYSANKSFKSSERDGFGFLAASGIKVARGRYLSPNGFAGYMTNLPLFLAGHSAEENRMPKNITSLIIHGRTSTNLKSLDNVHPFYYRSHYLAHNGILNWTGPNDQKPSPTCDSDQFLHWLVDKNLEWDQAVHHFSGFGAIGFYSPKTGILTVARDGASLSIARRVKSKGWVFATCAKQLIHISKSAGIALDTPPLDFPRHIMNIRDGEMVSDRSWLGFGSRVWTHLDTVSMGLPKETTHPIYTKSDSWKKNRELFPDYNPEVK